LENGSQIEAQTSFGRTPLHLASRKGNIDAMKILLERGANINAVDQVFKKQNKKNFYLNNIIYCP
jgi:ankyrin repeat protein